MGELGRLGRYELVRRLGMGGMAEVFEARSFGAAGVVKPVCVKRILPTYVRDRRFVQMFVDEARVSMALHHGNIAQVFDFGAEAGDVFLAMELVDGQPLSAVHRRLHAGGHRFPLPIALQVVREVLRALHHAHSIVDAQGNPLDIVHRDVSPQNVLLSYEGQVKLVDFGIARAAAVIDRGRGVRGKLPYVPPEQAADEEVDARADVYAAGAVLFELIANRTPIRGERPAMLMALTSGKIPSLSEVAPWVDEALVAVVDTATAPDPADRFPTALAFQEALADYQSRVERVTEDDIGALVRFVFAEDLGAEGRTVDLPVRYERKLLPLDVTPGAPQPRRSWAVSVIAVSVALGLALGLWAVLRGPGSGWSVMVRSMPQGARILVDGQDTGLLTDALLTGLEEGRPHRLRLELDGFESAERSLVPGSDVIATRLLPLAAAEVTLPKDYPPVEEAPPEEPERVTSVVREDGSVDLDVDLSAATIDPARARLYWMPVDPELPGRLWIEDEVIVIVTRHQSDAFWVAVDTGGAVLGYGIAEKKKAVQLPQGTARLGMAVLDGDTCRNNAGSIDVYLRIGRATTEYRLDGRVGCIELEAEVGHQLRDISGSRTGSVTYVGPADGPRLVLMGGGRASLMAFSRQPEDTTHHLDPGDSVPLDYVEYFSFFVPGPTPEPGRRVQLRYTPGAKVKAGTK